MTDCYLLTSAASGPQPAAAGSNYAGAERRHRRRQQLACVSRDRYASSFLIRVPPCTASTWESGTTRGRTPTARRNARATTPRAAHGMDTGMLCMLIKCLGSKNWSLGIGTHLFAQTALYTFTIYILLNSSFIHSIVEVISASALC